MLSKPSTGIYALRRGGSRRNPARVAAEPPRGAPWDLPILRRRWRSSISEMTGLDPKRRPGHRNLRGSKRGEVVEDSLETLDRSRQKMRVFGPMCMVSSPSSWSEAPTFSDIADRVLAILEGAVHRRPRGAGGTWRFSRAEFARSGSACTVSVLPRYPDPRAPRDAGREPRTRARSPKSWASLRARRIAQGRTCASWAPSSTCSSTISRPASPRDLWHVRVAERHARPEIVERVPGPRRYG